jgi:hypothetical protein
MSTAIPPFSLRAFIFCYWTSGLLFNYGQTGKRLRVVEFQKSRKPDPYSKQTFLKTKLGNHHLSNPVRCEEILKEIPCCRSVPQRSKERKLSSVWHRFQDRRHIDIGCLCQLGLVYALIAAISDMHCHRSLSNMDVDKGDCWIHYDCLFVFVATVPSSGFGGLEDACWPLVHPSSRVQTRPKPSDFSERKNPQHSFLRRGSKAGGFMS